MEVYERIINHMKNCKDFNEFSNSPISFMYRFEPLKHDLNGYYSCNLNRHGGTVRLIFSSDSDDVITLEYIQQNIIMILKGGDENEKN